MGPFISFWDFSSAPILARPQKKHGKGDYAGAICEQLVTQTGTVMVPSSDFGHANGARISMVLAKDSFREGIQKALELVAQEK